MINKYVGRRVEVIYQDGEGRITQRIVTVHSVRDGHAKVYDVDKRAYRTLAVDRILAAVPISGRRVRDERRSYRPIRSEFELQELGEQLVDAKEEKREVVLRVWKRREPVQGRIAKLDGMTQMVHVQKLGQTVKVPFVEILSVTDCE